MIIKLNCLASEMIDDIKIMFGKPVRGIIQKRELQILINVI